MDFLFARDPRQVHRLKGVLRPLARRYPAGTMFVQRGSWGCLVATGTRYAGYDPVRTADRIVVVSGDPLLALCPPDADGPAESRRSLAMADALARGEALRPHHPAAILSVETDGGAVRVITDAWGAVPVYAVGESGDLMLGSSPDLLALVRPCSFDRVSAAEKLAARQVCWPATLYREIRELPPGADLRLATDGGVEEDRWWTPPLPEPDRPYEEWATELETAVADTLDRIAAQVGPRGSITLSAGLDSRYLLALAAERGRLDLAAVNIAAAENVSSWVAGEVAARFAVPFRSVRRRIDHYASILLQAPPEIGSNTCLSDAHFAGQALGTLDPGHDAFLIGGFMADTLIMRGDPFTGDRAKAIRTKQIPRDAPRWASTAACLALDAETSASIDARWQEAERALGLTEGHSATLARIHPASRQGHKAHFDTARRDYPIYEPFMTAPALALGFRLPDGMKRPTDGKAPFYGRHLQPTADIPVNLAGSADFREMVGAMKRLLPQPLWPASLTHSDEWNELRGELAAQLAREVPTARRTLARLTGWQLRGLGDGRSARLVMECVGALERCRPE